MNRSLWLASARKLQIAAVAHQLGLRVHRDGKSFGPCPGCGRERRSSEDTQMVGTIDRRDPHLILESKVPPRNVEKPIGARQLFLGRDDAIACDFGAAPMSSKRRDRSLAARELKKSAKASPPTKPASIFGMRPPGDFAEPTLESLQAIAAFLPIVPPDIRATMWVPGIELLRDGAGHCTVFGADMARHKLGPQPLDPPESDNALWLSTATLPRPSRSVSSEKAQKRGQP